MAKKGFKPKLGAIIGSDAERNSGLVYDPEEPMPHSLTPYRTSYARPCSAIPAHRVLKCFSWL